MSGGAYDYVYRTIDEIRLNHTETEPRRMAFQKLLSLVGKAMHDIEWVDSCDYGIGDDHAAIDAVFAFLNADPKTIAKAHAYDGLKEQLKCYFQIEEMQDIPKENVDLTDRNAMTHEEALRRFVASSQCVTSLTKYGWTDK